MKVRLADQLHSSSRGALLTPAFIHHQPHLPADIDVLEGVVHNTVAMEVDLAPIHYNDQEYFLRATWTRAD